LKKLLIFALVFLYCDFIIAQKQTFNIDDLISLSKSKFGFVKSNGTINEYYGDFNCISSDNYIFDFNVGCGNAGDVITLLVKANSEKKNTFNLYLEKGSTYYGSPAVTERKVGEFLVISENEIKGDIKLCLNKKDGCCGEEGENFTLSKISNNDSHPTINNNEDIAKNDKSQYEKEIDRNLNAKLK